MSCPDEKPQLICKYGSHESQYHLCSSSLDISSVQQEFSELLSALHLREADLFELYHPESLGGWFLPKTGPHSRLEGRK